MVKTYTCNGCKDGERSSCNKEMLCFFGTTIQKASSAGSSCLLLIICLVVWSSAARKDLVKLKLAQNRETHFALNCNLRADKNTMHVSLSWLRVEERLTASLLLLIRNINVLKIPICLLGQLTHSSDTHTYPTRYATRILFTVPKSRTNSRKRTVLYRALIAWNLLPSHIAQINSKPGFKKQIKQHLRAQHLSPI